MKQATKRHLNAVILKALALEHVHVAKQHALHLLRLAPKASAITSWTRCAGSTVSRLTSSVSETVMLISPS